ncbi:hypothetical protein BD410DRAFT_768564 [Rickenella mellea]|uniref:RING-type E3 ubiquitin transferase n=1 Tax=Rickenella mellea TaxID=50990 RepID=A0A4Y7Q929_9AGAM|nr:hypothetical protein BD410DRAFT_768564 [Rickenella mellea]
MSTPNAPPQDRENADVEAGLPPFQQQQPRSSISSFIFVSFVLFMLMNNGGEELLGRNQYKESLESLEYQHGNLSAWMNGTAANFTIPERDTTEISIVDSIMSFGVPLNPQFASYYDNITGFIHGSAEYHNLSLYDESHHNSEHTKTKLPPWVDLTQPYLTEFNISEATERMGLWNWTASNKLAFTVLEKKPRVPKGEVRPTNTSIDDDITVLHGRLDFVDSESGDELHFDLEAVHFVSNGSLFGLAEAVGRHIDLRHLPSLVPNISMNATAAVVEVELRARINRLRDMIYAGAVDLENPYSDEAPRTTCPFNFYGQIVPTDIPLFYMKELEAELDHPTGVTTMQRPELKLNGVLISKECGMLYEMKEGIGLKSQRFWRKVTTYAGMAGFAYLIQLILVTRQTGASLSPASVSRVSRWTFYAQAAADAISFVGHITFAVLADGRASISLIAPAFLACILLTHEAQFAVVIHQIQAPESITATNPRPAPAPAPTLAAQDRTEADGQTGTPAPSRPSPPRPSLFAIISEVLHANPQARVWLTIVLSLTVIVRIILSPSLALWVMGIIYSMFWTPQIIRSARRGTTGGLKKEYLIGTTVCRGFFALYIFGCPKNVLNLETTMWIYALVAVLSFQVVIIILQEYFGPAFFLPSGSIQVDVYDYHPPLPVSDFEAPTQSLGDCAICMENIIVPTDRRRKSLSEKSISSRPSREEEKKKEKGGSSILDAVQMGLEAAGRGKNARKIWAVAPCHHTFHSACLERWLAIKNICPQCRRPLPPL